MHMHMRMHSQTGIQHAGTLLRLLPAELVCLSIPNHTANTQASTQSARVGHTLEHTSIIYVMSIVTHCTVDHIVCGKACLCAAAEHQHARTTVLPWQAACSPSTKSLPTVSDLLCAAILHPTYLI